MLFHLLSYTCRLYLRTASTFIASLQAQPESCNSLAIHCYTMQSGSYIRTGVVTYIHSQAVHCCPLTRCCGLMRPVSIYTQHQLYWRLGTARYNDVQQARRLRPSTRNCRCYSFRLWATIPRSACSKTQ